MSFRSGETLAGRIHYIELTPFTWAEPAACSTKKEDEKIKVRYYRVSSEIVRRRDAYYQVLEDVQNRRVDVTAWYLWFIQCIHSSIEQSWDMIANILLRHDFWNKHAQTLITDRQKKVINRILEAGPGNFEGGLTTRKYVNIAGVSSATAFREITDLTAKNILRRLPGSGRNAHYDLIWPSVRQIGA